MDSIKDIIDVVKEPNFRVVHAMITNNPDLVNVKSDDYDNWTPLYVAAEHGMISNVVFLLSKGADPNLKCTPALETPLHTAAFNGRTIIVKLLIANGAEVNIKSDNPFSQTPLFLAAMRGHIDVVECLLEAGADTNIATFDGETPINVAYDNGHLGIVELLKERLH